MSFFLLFRRENISFSKIKKKSQWLELKKRKRQNLNRFDWFCVSTYTAGKKRTTCSGLMKTAY